MKPDYGYKDAKHTYAHTYLLPALDKIIKSSGREAGASILDLGCGNGSLCGYLAQKGFKVVGVDSSQSGIQLAKQNYPQSFFLCCSVEESAPPELINKFDIVISTEVIEHLYLPRKLLSLAAQCLKPGGTMIVSTPYHGYLKNLFLSLTNHWDRHFTVGWDGGHIKFFSVASLRRMVGEAGFQKISFRFAGRFAYVWKSMICIAEKPSEGRR